MAKLLTAFILGVCLLGVHRTDAKPIAVTPGEQVNLTLKLVNVNEQPLKQVTVEWDRTSLPPWIQVSHPVITTSLNIPASTGQDKPFERLSVALTVAKDAPLNGSASIRLQIRDRDGELWRPQITVQVVPRLPSASALGQNYPNPFNPETWIPYQIHEASDVSIRIYDVSGQVVRALRLGHKAPGFYETRSAAAYWDGRNAHGESVGSGIYFYQLMTNQSPSAMRKMLIIK